MNGWTGDAWLYHLSQPVPYGDGENKTEHVIVSSTSVPITGPETYIFPASERGEVLDWGELEGSQRGVMDHAAVLKDAGFTI